MPGRLGFTMLDYSDERSAFSLATGDVTAGTLAGLLTEVGALRTAIEGITLGVVANERLTVFDTALSATPPASELAQVESAWLVQYSDDVSSKNYTLTIGTADIVGRLLAQSDEADLADTQIAAFIAAFETTARSPEGNAVTVQKITFVGRNR